MAARIRKDDQVIVIAGKSKGKTGRVVQVLPREQRVVVEKVNLVKKHVKPNRKYPQGGIVEMEASLHWSNIMPIDPKTGKGTRIRFESDTQGKKQRLTQRSQQVLTAKA